MDWQKTLEKFRTALDDAQKQRDKKQNWTEVNGEKSLEWIFFERQAMFDLTNEYRKLNNLDPISMNDIKKVEDSASGHCDYSRKFSLYCAELGAGLPHRP